jgi:hypothetical protein
MNKDIQTKEGALVKTNADASAARSVSSNEGAEAHGFYRASCIGPVEHMRDRYVALRDRLSNNSLLGFLDRLANGKRLIEEFLSIPLEEKWEDAFENVVCTVGKNLALDTYLAGSAYTVTGPFMGLINTNASSAAAGDTMASHAAWLEVGGTNAPAYTSPRKTCAWSAAASGSKALSSALAFPITSAGTVGGCFIVFGSGAVSTIDSTAGTLYSAGAFSGGSKTVSNGDTLSVSYSTSL